MHFIAQSICYDAGSPHINNIVNKDSRWFAWYDSAKSWNRVWHLETMVHAFAFWCEGSSPWALKPQIDDNGGSSDSYSSRIYAWNVSRFLTIIYIYSCVY